MGDSPENRRSTAALQDASVQYALGITVTFWTAAARRCFWIDEGSARRSALVNKPASRRCFDEGTRILTLDRLSRRCLQAGSRLGLQSIAPASLQTWRFQSQACQPYGVRR